MSTNLKDITTTLFEIDPRNLPASKSKDRLRIRLNAKLSRKVSAERGHEVSVYDVVNLTQMSACKVEFSNVNGRKLGGCTCEARVVCKHITRTVPLHVYRKTCERAARAQAAAPSQPDDDGLKLWRDALA